eukprot:1947231-Amphidinium_carterae.1
MSDSAEARKGAGNAAAAMEAKGPRAHLWRLRDQATGQQVLRTAQVKAHAAEPDPQLHWQQWLHWQGNRLADEYAKREAHMHTEARVAGRAAETVSNYLKDLALWVGFQVRLMATGIVLDCDSVPPPCIGRQQ